MSSSRNSTTPTSAPPEFPARGDDSSASTSSTATEVVQTPPSRRQRLWGLARATRETYIPRLATSVTSLASGVAGRSSEIEYDDFGSPLTFPKDTTFTLYPTYTRYVKAADSTTGQSGYNVSVRGWMWCPGLMSRKNRLVLSLAKQVTKGRGSRAAQVAVERLNNDPSISPDSLKEETDGLSDTESLSSSPSVASSRSSDSPSIDNLVKERLQSFIARSIPRAHLSVVVGAVDSAFASKLSERSIYTDVNGNFECEIFTPYEPSVVQVSAVADEAICSFQEVSIVPGNGIGVISDIDDTVKLTGVIGDKRELLNKVLIQNISTWNIPPVVAWYKELVSKFNATFYYVSNSPWQFFSLISQYFQLVKLPPGSVHLKQYTGNILASLMEPSTSRKTKSLRKILDDFPEKKFICIGDSGEHDLEAYVDLAKLYPGRILAIYIRAVPNSFSSIDDSKVLNELKWMISSWYKRQDVKMKNRPESSIPDLIELSDDDVSKTSQQRSAKLPPLIPQKPTSLKGNTVRKLPPLPERKYKNGTEAPITNDNRSGKNDVSNNSPDVSENTSIDSATKSVEQSPEPMPPPTPKRRTATNTLPISESKIALQDIGRTASDRVTSLYEVDDFFELEDIDTRAAAWIQKLTEVLYTLDGTKTKVEFFEDSDDTFFKNALRDLSEII